MSLARKIEQIWYEGSAWRWALVPLSLLYRAVVTFRRYRWLKRPGAAYRSRVPLIVIGNLTVGGTGKTPLTLACIALARALGLRPGVVSRGYGGKAPHYPCRVDQSPDAALVGDEPLLIWRNSACPVVVSPIRADAVALLESAFSPDIIFSDDGLQHYAMARQAEIVVVDGKRGYGNGWCLPAGPLREPLRRLAEVDLEVYNGADPPHGSGLRFDLVPDEWITVSAPELRKSTADFLQGNLKDCVAIAGIGNPERFFATLHQMGLASETHSFPDHYQYTAEDFVRFRGRTLLMTEKDAVKCAHLDLKDAWYLSVKAQLSPELTKRLTHLMLNGRL